MTSLSSQSKDVVANISSSSPPPPSSSSTTTTTTTTTWTSKSLALACSGKDYDLLLDSIKDNVKMKLRESQGGIIIIIIDIIIILTISLFISLSSSRKTIQWIKWQWTSNLSRKSNESYARW